jgi:short/branched chain acyl-CoA dehydrogenase
VAEREIAPHIAQWDREHRFPVELLAKLGAAGLMGLTVPGPITYRTRSRSKP